MLLADQLCGCHVSVNHLFPRGASWRSHRPHRLASASPCAAGVPQSYSAVAVTGEYRGLAATWVVGAEDTTGQTNLAT